jgi:hypothetical protein
MATSPVSGNGSGVFVVMTKAQEAKARFLAQVKKNAHENTVRKFAPVFLLLKLVLAALAIWGATVFAKAHGVL